MKSFDICIVGLGYIGLPIAVFLANKNFNVLGVDINEKIIRTLQEGKKIRAFKDGIKILKIIIIKIFKK